MPLVFDVSSVWENSRSVISRTNPRLNPLSIPVSITYNNNWLANYIRNAES